MNAGELKVVLKLDDGQFKASLIDAEGNVKSFAKASLNSAKDTQNSWRRAASDIEGSLSGASSAMSGYLKAGLAVAAGGSFGFIAAAKASWQQVSAVEQATVAMGAYEKNAGSVGGVLKELLAYARSDMGVLFQREDLFGAAQGLKLMGAETGRLTDYVKIMSRSVGLGLSTWDGLGNVIGRVGSTGKLYADDLQYLQNAGFQLDGSLSGTSQSFESLFALLDRGIPAEAVAGQASTIDGRLIRLQSSFRQLGNDILGVDADTSKFIKGGLGDSLVGMLGDLTEFLKTPEMRDGIRSLGKQLSEVTTASGPLIKGVLSWIVKNMDTVVAGIAAFASVLIVAKLAAIGFSIALSANPIGLIIGAIAALIGALVFLQIKFNIFGKAWDMIRGAWSKATDFFTGVFESITSIVSGAWSSIVGAISGAWKSVLSVFDATISFFREWGLSILAVMFLPFSLALGLIIMNWDSIKSFFSGIWSFIASIFSPVVGFFSSVFMSALSAIEIVWSVAVPYFAQLWESIKVVFSVVSSWFTGVFQGAWNGIKSVFSVVGVFFKGVWDTILGVFGGIGNAIGSTIGNAFKQVINNVLRFAGNIINDFISSINTAIKIINAIPGVKIPILGNMNIPQLAEGGIVTKATLAVVGEGSEPEAIMPLSKIDKILQLNKQAVESNPSPQITQNVYPQTPIDMNIINRSLIREARRA